MSQIYRVGPTSPHSDHKPRLCPFRVSSFETTSCFSGNKQLGNGLDEKYRQSEEPFLTSYCPCCLNFLYFWICARGQLFQLVRKFPFTKSAIFSVSSTGKNVRILLEPLTYIIMCQSSICLCLWPVTHLPLVERLKCGPPVVVTESQLMSLSWCSILYPRSEIASPLFLSYQWAPWSLFTTFWVMWVPEHFLLFFNHTLWAKANAAGFAIDTVVQKRWQCCAATQVTNKAPC